MLLLENISHDELKKNIKELYDYCIQFLEIDRAPKVIFKKDEKNAEDLFGKTGYYDPDQETIALFITGRHAKDILRSFAHELVHHEQKCNGKSDSLDLSSTATDPAYAMHDEGLRELEREAFTEGSLLFRDWCDTKKMERKNTMAESKKIIDLVLERVTERLIRETKEATFEKIKKQAKAPKRLTKPPKVERKPDFLDLNKDGDTAQSMKSAAEDAKKKGLTEDDSFTSGEAIGMEETKGMKCEACGSMYQEGKKHMCKEVKKESKEMPHQELFKRKDRLFNERFSEYEQWKFEELLKKAIKK